MKDSMLWLKLEEELVNTAKANNKNPTWLIVLSKKTNFLTN